MADDETWGEESTVVGNKDALANILRGGRRDRAYVIVIAGPNVGEMFKLESISEIGRGGTVRVRLTDTEISRRHARLLIEGDSVYVEDLGSTNGTFVNGEAIDRRLLQDGDKIQVGTTTILKFSYHDELEEQFQRRMYDAALRDGPTGAFNKKYFLDRLESELAYAVRHGSPLALVLFDLDHFKKVNDGFGHLAGDYVLKTMAGGILESVRKEDVFARYGGEEFAMLSRGLDAAAGEVFAERLRAWVAAYPFVFEGAKLPITVSVGVTALPETPCEDPLVMIGQADKALYAAKSGGRNQVRVYGRT